MIRTKRDDLCFVFDMDDTLYEEVQFQKSGFVAVGKWLEENRSLKGFARIATEIFDKGNRRTTFDEALRRMELEPTKELVELLLGQFRSHTPQICMAQDAADFLDSHVHRTSAALITDGFLETQKNKAQALGLSERIGHLIFTDSFGREFWKPAPRAFETASLALPDLPVVYIADNPLKDFAVPYQLGWRTIRIIRPGGIHAKLPSQVDVNYTVESFAEIQELLKC